jgi:predicted Fe-Mo cluster-binding NifX family protein
VRIAITSTGNSTDSFLDHRFARCAFFIFYDTESEAIEIIPNPNKDLEEMAGPASVEFVASKMATKIVSGEFGVKIKPLLDSMKIQLIVVKNKKIKVSEIIQMLNHKKR